MALTQVFLVCADGHTVRLAIEDAATYDLEAHGPVVEARVATTTFADLDPEGTAFPNPTRLSRSLTRQS